MDTDKDIAILLALSNKLGPTKAVLTWSYQKDLQMLEEVQKKVNKWPRRFWRWFHCIDILERQVARSKERLEKGTLRV
jgi:hypothetical protein